MLFYKIKIQKKQLTTLLLGAFVLSGFFGLFVPKDALAAQATLSLSPSNGRFEIDSTFEISVFLNTHGNSVNTIELNLRYPPDKLQLVSSSTGQSIIGIWTSQPKYNNLTGAVNLVGGIPNGINVSKGLISTFTFRVKAVGSAVVRFENSRVLLNDGLGTEVLTQNVNSIYDLTLPAPAGPLVVSDTHPDQTQWYKDSTVSLRWGDEGGSEGFSYILSDEPIDIPDNISEGTRHEVDYKNLSEGRHYFHIRALRAGAWGGTTHYALNIDPAAPADFRVEIVPGARTTRRQPVLQFSTTDASSGLDHYELKIIPLGQNSATVTPQDENQQIFIEAQSPFITSELELGRYDIIVRAYDKAGNYKDATERLEIVNAIFRYVDGQGLEIRSWLVLPWWLLLILLALVVILLLYLISRLHLWHRTIDSKREQGEMPANLKQQIEELQKYREKYGKIMSVIALLLLTSFFAVNAQAQTGEVLAPPVVNAVSQNISDEDIFYIGGQTGSADSEVVIYLQSLDSSATISETVKSDKKGEWFYRHNTFLAPGNYLLWTQTKIGNQLSPPSPQISMLVETTALHFGGSRISYTTLYLALTIILSLIVLILLTYIIHKFRLGHIKHQMFVKEITEAEASLRRGFAVLNRDIQAELEIIKKAKMSQALSAEELKREEQLLKDLMEIEQYLAKEIWDIEEVERAR